MSLSVQVAYIDSPIDQSRICSKKLWFAANVAVWLPLGLKRHMYVATFLPPAIKMQSQNQICSTYNDMKHDILFTQTKVHSSVTCRHSQTFPQSPQTSRARILYKCLFGCV